MPIYEFYCPDNHRIYSFYARSLAYSDRTPRCPDEGKFRMERMISSFAITGRAKEKPELPEGADADDPRMAAMMAEMEGELDGLDDEHPDPKLLARLMRKMSEMGGGKVPGELEEIIRRMEAGEDPDKLDAEYGDAMEDVDPLGDEQSPAGEKLKAQLRAFRRQPRRDPVLYEMSDFLDASQSAGAGRRPRSAKR